ncbi:MAG: hypothetical protein IKI58_07280 [Oscillospiraceae bacterium]|nr:hypothetical protein [Oscillospiraceae bacterium]
MKSKKMLTLFSACVLLVMGGCGDKTAMQAASPQIEEISAADTSSDISTDVSGTEIMTGTTALSEDTDTTTETTAASGEPVTGETEETLTIGLQKKIEQWDKGCVNMNIRFDQIGGLSEELVKDVIKMDLKIYQQKCCVDLEMYGFQSRTVYDGEYTYQIDDASKCYSKTKSETMQETDSQANNALSDVSAADFVEKGQEALNGIPTLYEEFKMKDSDGNNEDVKFFYNDEGNLIGCKIKQSDGQEVFCWYTISYTETVDESLFTAPSGYTEVSYEKIIEIMAQGMMGMLDQMMGSADLNG